MVFFVGFEGKVGRGFQGLNTKCMTGWAGIEIALAVEIDGERVDIDKKAIKGIVLYRN